MSHFYLVAGAPLESTDPIDGAQEITREQYEKSASLHSPPNLPGFRAAIASLPQWRSLISSDGRAGELSRCIAEGDLATATIWWADLVGANLIGAELQADMLGAAISNNMPPEILSALGFQAQN